METVDFADLPPGCVVRGNLYLDPATEYWTGDVVQVGLPTGHTVDVGWDEDRRDLPFRVVVYRESFGDRSADRRFATPRAAAEEVSRLARSRIAEQP